MKLKLSLLLLSAVFALQATHKMVIPELHFNPPPRELKLSKTMIDLIANGKSNMEIVAPADAGETALYAGEELQKYLQQATKVKIPLLRKRGNAKYAIILGDNAIFKKAFPKINIQKLTIDGFYTIKKGNEIYIAGRDDKKGKKIRDFIKSSSGTWLNMTYFHRATLFGAYDFLERFAGVRFFFAGDIGTVVPPMKKFRVPSSIHIMDRPDFTNRKVSWYVGRDKSRRDEWYDNTDPVYGSNMNYLRWRLETRCIPNCHGLAQVGYHHRFGKTNPEYFAMYEDGKRYAVKQKNFAGQLCLTNKGLREEIYKDMKSYLMGEPASVRKIDLFGRKQHFWCSAGFQPGFVNVMPQDAFYKCHCPDCRKYFNKGKKAASNLVWDLTAEIANRLKKDKIPGYVTQMGYHFYKTIPDTKLPDNVIVMYATYGPWFKNQKQADADIRGWSKKMNSKIAFWNYCINNAKWGQNYSAGDVPHTTAKTIAKYYQDRKQYFYGGFLECETHHFIWGVPNIYAATRIFWNNDLNIDDMMKDFYSKLFGNAAGELEQFFDTVEKKWLSTRKIVDTAIGPQTLPVTQYEIWTKLYPTTELAKLKALFDRAEKKVKNDAMALKRVKFFRERFLNIMLNASEKYMASAISAKEVRIIARKRTKPADLKKPIYQRGNTAFLRSLKKPKTEIAVQAIVSRDDKNLYVTFRCEEPEMNKLKFSKTHADAKKNLWKDALFEIFLNPSGDRHNRYQVVIHPSGYMYAMAHPSRKTWDAGLKARVHVDKKFWSGELTIPLKALGKVKGEFPFNMGYSRQRIGEDPYTRTFAWSPYTIDDFHQVDKYGSLSLDTKQKDANIVKDWNFDAPFNDNRLGAWYVAYPSDPDFDGAIEPDSSEFVTGGQSLYLRMDAGKHGVSASQNIKLKPDTKYTFSYWIKYDIDNKSGVNAVIGAGRNFFMPEKQIVGKMEWHKRSYTFKTPKKFNGNANVRFTIHRPKAQIWVDNVRVEEIKK